MKSIRTIKVVLAALMMMPAMSCEKFFTVKSENQISDIQELLQTPDDARNVLNGAYDVLVNALNGRVQNMCELKSSNAAEPVLNNDLSAVYTRSTNFFITTPGGIYQDLYLAIFRANLLLDYAKNIEGISASELAQLEAESKFIRAMAHHWVLKVWSQPWGYQDDSNHPGIVIRSETSQLPLPRSTVRECFAFIQADLLDAYTTLPESNGFYATKYAAAALLAYTYWQQGDYANCIDYSNLVINSGLYSLEPTLDSFHAWTDDAQNTTNPESIFASNSIQVNNDGRNGGFTGMYRAYGVTGATLSMSLEAFNLFAFNGADNRGQWVVQDGSQYQLTRFGTNETNQQGINFFDMPMLRLTVLQLIKAESLAALGNNGSEVVDILNAIRDRAFGPGIFPVSGAATASELVDIARDEFRKETLGEGLYLDLQMRQGALGENVIIRGAPWNCDGMAIQFPNSEGTGIDFVFNPEGGCE
ncbi:MAG: RagB/SusD family nutrient uptake outer membrane protein [Flavobacteriales bacterium]